MARSSSWNIHYNSQGVGERNFKNQQENEVYTLL